MTKLEMRKVQCVRELISISSLYTSLNGDIITSEWHLSKITGSLPPTISFRIHNKEMER